MKCSTCKRMVSEQEDSVAISLLEIRDLDPCGLTWCAFCAVQAFLADMSLELREAGEP